MEIKFDAEKLVTTPIIEGGKPFLSPTGCGCAKGIAYVACHEDIDWSPYKSEVSGTISNYCAADNDKVARWAAALPHEIYGILTKYEKQLFQDISGEQVKAEMIKELDAKGYLIKKDEAALTIV